MKRKIQVCHEYILLQRGKDEFYLGANHWSLIEKAIKLGRSLPEGKLETLEA